MPTSPHNTLPLGDFAPADYWQNHVNAIFYGMKGPGIHNHFQTYVSLDHRLAHAIADEYFAFAQQGSDLNKIKFVQEWGVGNGNLAACFLSRLKEIDSDDQVYSKTNYILCDYSKEILKGVRANPNLQIHAGRFSTLQVNAESMDCFRPQSIFKIISNEIWDDLTTKILLKHQGLLYEEYLQPTLNPQVPDTNFEEFVQLFSEKNFEGLKKCSPFLEEIIWERDFQRVDISDWPYAEVILSHLGNVTDEIPIPINIGAFVTVERARFLLEEKGQGYCGFDYGMPTLKDLNTEGRPYFKLYGGQYTCMVNFPLLEEIGKSIGFNNIQNEHQHRYLGRTMESPVISVVEIVQNHPEISQMRPWDIDLLMLNTLHALNGRYQSPYKRKMDYPAMPGTPKKYRKLIQQSLNALDPRGVPDTVAYVTKEEVHLATKRLLKLGYRDKDLQAGFINIDQPVSFVHMNFQ